MERIQKNYNIFSLFVISLIAGFIQQHLFLNWDVSQLMFDAELILKGGNYVTDFYTPNPPAIFFLYWPAILISHLFSVDRFLSLQIYVFSLGFISINLSYLLIRRYFEPQDHYLSSCILVILATVFFILPVLQIGQREHLYLIFIMPYVFLVLNNMDAKAVSRYFAICVGVFASCGFSIKPQFLLTFICLELFYMWHTRNLFSWLRWETATIFTLMIGYAVIMFIYFPSFVWIIIPDALRYYYNSVGFPFKMLIFNPALYICYLSLLFYVLWYKRITYKSLATVLVVTLIGLLITYFSQRFLSYYHSYPAFCVGFMLATLLFIDFSRKPALNGIDYFIVTLVGVLSLIYTYFCFSILTTTLALMVNWYFGFFAALLFILFRLDNKNIVTALSFTIVIIFISLIFSKYVQATTGFLFHFWSVTIFIIMLYGLFSSKKRCGAGEQMFRLCLGLILFSSSVWVVNLQCNTALTYKSNLLQPIVNFMRTQPGNQSFYFFSEYNNYTFALRDYTSAKLVQRIDSFWMVKGLTKQINQEGESTVRQYIHNNKDPNYIFNIVADDFAKFKPQLILIDNRQLNITVDGKKTHFDYLSFCLENDKFAREWRHYRYYTSITNQFGLNLLVYVRS